MVAKFTISIKLLVFFSFAVSYSSYGLRNNLDSLKIVKFNNLAESALDEGNWEQAQMYAEKSVELAEKLPYDSLHAQSLQLLARTNYRQNLRGSALKYFLRSLKLWEQLDDTNGLSSIYTDLGNMYKEWGFGKKALEYYLEALVAINNDSLSTQKAELLELIATEYTQNGNYNNALIFLQKLFYLYREWDDKEKMLTVLAQIVDVNIAKGSYEEAVKYEKQILGIGQLQNDTVRMSDALFGIATTYQKKEEHIKSLEYFLSYLNLKDYKTLLKTQPQALSRYIEALIQSGLAFEKMADAAKSGEDQYQSALVYFSTSLNIMDELLLKGFGYRLKVAKTYNYVARVYFKLRDYKNAVFYNQRALELLKEDDVEEILIENYENLVASYRRLKKFQKALKFYDLLSEIKEKKVEKEHQKQKDELREQSVSSRKQFIINKTEQMVIDQEFDSLEIKQLQLEAVNRGKELELKEFMLQNEQLSREKAQQDLILTQQQLEVERQERKISDLNQKQLLQEIELQQKSLDELKRLKRIEFLELDKEIQDLELANAQSSRKYYIAGMSFSIIILVLILLSYFNTRKANIKLSKQKDHIAQQAQILREANANIIAKSHLIEDQNKELTSLNKEKNQIIHIIAHDLRNPMAVAMSLIDFVRSTTKSLNTDQKEAINITHRSLQRMNEMVIKILDIRAIESHKVNIYLEKTNLRPILENVMESFSEIAIKKEIQLNFKSFSHQPYAKVDLNYITQVIENLVSNAIKFSPNNRSIHLNLVENNANIRIEVQDEGPGLTSADKEKLFTKFQKLSAKPTNGEQSIGLGLSIVKKYVELMNGKVWCESEQGQGATFIIEFQKLNNIEVAA